MTIMVLGRTGDGKTAFTKNLAKRYNNPEAQRFQPSAGAESHTQEIGSFEFYLPGFG